MHMQIKNILSYEVVRFLFIGILNTLVGYLFFVFFYFILHEELLSLLFAYIFGIIFNYSTYSKYVFTVRDQRIFINFVLIYILSFIVNSIILKLLIFEYLINTYIAQFISLFFVVPILYILNKKYVFIEEEKL